MSSRLAKLVAFVVLALPAALVLGALVAWAMPASVSTEAASIPQTAARTDQASDLGARSIPSELRGASSPSAAAPAGTAQATVLLGTKPTRASTPARAEALAASTSITLCAKAGTKTMPDSTVVNIWGFALKPSALPCSDSSVVPDIPGPLLDLGVAVGEVLSITLDNGLAENVALAFPGQQPLVPDTIGATPGGTKTYMVTMSRPGTFLYEAGGPNAPRQVAMGLYGALVVPSGTAGQAYGTAASAYDSQAVLVLGEIDPVLNGVLPDPPNGAFDMNNYAPKYFLINGQAYDDTAEIEALAGDRVLLRYVNGALSHHTMELLGLHQREIAEDAYPLDDPLDLVSETFPTGTTGDMIVTVPASATVGTSFPLFSRNLNVTNDGTFPGGMLTYISVVSGP